MAGKLDAVTDHSCPLLLHVSCRRCLGITPPDQAHSWQQQHGSSSSGVGGVWSSHSGKKRRVLQAYSAEDCGKLSELYRELCQAFPKSLACHRMPLDFLVRQ
jgi:hypothetical protein